jgi:sulfatase maturation enzyme AslB (radical SAM superfamily)
MFLQLCTTTRGDYSLCCQAQQQIESSTDWRHWWSSKELNERRQTMLEGNWPKECYSCEQAEHSGRGSLRQSYLRNYPAEQLNQAVEQWQQTGHAPDPVSLDLAVGNTCNLKCRQCNAEWSSAIAAEQGVKVARPQAPVEWYKELPAEPLHTIKVQGGEPLLQPRLWQWLGRLQQPEQTRFEMVTNGTRDPVPHRDIMMRFRERILFVSVDAIGDRAAELRVGTDWQRVEQTIREFQTWPETYTAVICCVYKDNIEDVPHVQAWADRNGVDVIWNVLTDPEHLSLAHVPAAVRDRINKDALPNEITKALDNNSNIK